MSLPRHALIFTAIALFLSTTSANISRACDCDIPTSAKESLKHSDAVFVGKVIEIKKTKLQKYVTFNVLKIWKGKIGKQITITTAIDGGACGYHFSKKGDGTYLLYCHQPKKAKQHSTDICTRTRSLANAAKDIKELGDARLPK